MGTHPIFESDFDCLTDFLVMDEGESRSRLCYFCQSPGPQFSQPIKSRQSPERQVSKIWICDSCKENQKFDSMLNGSGESESRSEKMREFTKLERRLISIEKEKAYLKQCWRLLKCALDQLYSARNECGVTEAIAEIVPRQRELESYVITCVDEDHVQLLERLDSQCRSHIVRSKSKILTKALFHKKTNDITVQYPIDFLNIALDDWEKFQSVTRVVSAVVRPMEVSCKIHWKTQARSLYHRLIYTNIDIHEKLRHCNTRVQQEANICDEKKDFRYRGILRRYRKYEEEMTFASNDRSPDVCVRPTFGDDWTVDGDMYDPYGHMGAVDPYGHLLLSDSSGTESIPENISEANSESSNDQESPNDFKNSALLLNTNFFEGEGDVQEGPLERCAPSPDDDSSISTSETTESSDSFDETDLHNLHNNEYTREMFAALLDNKNGLSPAPGDLNQFNLKNGHTEGASDLFGKTLEHIKRLKPAKPAEDETAQNARKLAVPRKPGVTRKLSISSEQGDEEGTVDCVEEAFSEGEEENSAEHHHHHHDSYDHAPCGSGRCSYDNAPCVHCELLGNTPTNRGNMRDELARDRLRKKLKKRIEQKEKVNVKNDATSRPPLDDAPSPSLSSSTQSREVEKEQPKTAKTPNGKKLPFGFSMAMEVRPVRSSTASKNQDNQEENEWKREWIELALEEYRDVAEREKMTSLPSNSLLSLQNCLRSEIGKRLKQTSKDPHFRSFVAEVELLELIAREKEEKERKRKKKKEENKKRKKKEEKHKMAENAENANLENLENIQKEKKVQEEEIESIFTPKDDLDSLDPDDRDVEIFKKFCLDCAPIFPRLKLPLQSLNLLPLVEPH